jgi:hypothetical protein
MSVHIVVRPCPLMRCSPDHESDTNHWAQRSQDDEKRNQSDLETGYYDWPSQRQGPASHQASGATLVEKYFVLKSWRLDLLTPWFTRHTSNLHGLIPRHGSSLFTHEAAIAVGKVAPQSFWEFHTLV